MTHPPFLTVRQAAKELGVSRQTIYNLCNDGRLPHGRIPGGSNIRIRRDVFDEFLNKMFTEQPATTTPDISPEPPTIQLPKAEKPKVRNKTIFRPDGTPDIAAMVKLKAKQNMARH